MPNDNMTIDPKTLSTIKDLPLLAKTVVDGFMNGFNKSTVKGPGLEFSQYRSYQPGDDLRQLDWRMFARSDRYYIRESEVETSISVRFLVDASASMLHEDSGISKIKYARYLTAALAYLANLQGDAVGLYVFQNGGLFSLASKQDPQHLQRLFYQLEQIQPAGKFTNEVYYKEIFTGAARRELLVFITDMYQQNGEINRLLDSFAALKHEVIVFQLMSSNELEMDFKGFSTLEDLETGETIEINPHQLAKYREAVKEKLAVTRMELLGKGIVHEVLNTSEPLDKALRDFLTRRAKS